MSDLQRDEMKYWLSCVKFTIQADTDQEDRIVYAAPIARRFLGQSLVNLIRWMRTLGGFRMGEL